MKKFDFPSMFEIYENCWATIGVYSANPMCFAVQIWCQEGPVSTLTTYCGNQADPETLISRNQAFVDVNNNPLAPEWLEEQEIAKPVILNGRPVIVRSGYCGYSLYEFSEEKLAEMDPKGWASHCESYAAAYKKEQRKLERRRGR